jgi:hypothetical protein
MVLMDHVLRLRWINTVLEDGQQLGAVGQTRRNLRSGECSSTISMTPTMAGTLQDE